MIGDEELRVIADGAAEYMADDAGEPLKTVATWCARLVEDARAARKLLAAFDVVRANERMGEVASKHLQAAYRAADQWRKA